MDPFDYFVKRELCCPAYLRYVDDFALESITELVVTNKSPRGARAHG